MPAIPYYDIKWVYSNFLIHCFLNSLEQPLFQHTFSFVFPCFQIFTLYISASLDDSKLAAITSPENIPATTRNTNIILSENVMILRQKRAILGSMECFQNPTALLR